MVVVVVAAAAAAAAVTMMNLQYLHSRNVVSLYNTLSFNKMDVILQTMWNIFYWKKLGILVKIQMEFVP